MNLVFKVAKTFIFSWFWELTVAIGKKQPQTIQVEVKAAEAAGHAAASNAKGHGPATWLVAHLAASPKK